MRATRFFTVRAGTDGWTTSTCAVVPPIATGSKSLEGSYGTFIEARICDVSNSINNEDRISVGCCQCGSARTDIPAGTRHVFDIMVPPTLLALADEVIE